MSGSRAKKIRKWCMFMWDSPEIKKQFKFSRQFYRASKQFYVRYGYLPYMA